MSIAILVMNDPMLEDLYMINLRLYVGVDVIPKKNAVDVMALLEHLPNVDIILACDKINAEETAKDIFVYLENKKTPIPMVVFSQDESWAPLLDKRGLFLQYGADLKEVIRGVAKILHVTSKDMMEQIVPEYYPLEIKYLSSLTNINCDIFVKINTDEYAKILEANAPIDASFFNELKEKEITKFYIQSNIRLRFVNDFTRQLIAHLKNKSLPLEDRISHTHAALEFVHSQFKNLAFEEETVSLAQEAIDSMVKVVKDVPKIEELLDKLLKNQASFHYKHCQLGTFICAHIVKYMDWGSSEQSSKLAFVSFFHDIFLTSDEEVLMASNENLEKSTLSKERKDVVMKHAYMASDLLSKMPQLPFGADTIIKEHHGNRNGMGLNPSLAANISPLAMVFMIAEEYIFYLLGAVEAPKEHDEIVSILSKKYEHFSKYLSIVKTLDKLKKQ